MAGEETLNIKYLGWGKKQRVLEYENGVFFTSSTYYIFSSNQLQGPRW